ncbi:MAG: hypothetical protein ACTSQ8_21565 [Candidatus Helarchaeota archaeon]
MSELITTSSKVVSQIVEDMQQQRLENREKRRLVKQNWERLRKQSEGFSRFDRQQSVLDYENTRMFFDIMPDNSWKDQRCFIVGGGKSLKDFKFSKLKNELVIGINRAYEKIDCTINFAMDHSLYEWIINGDLGMESKNKFNDFKGIKVWLDSAGYDYPDGIHILNKSTGNAFSKSLKEGIIGGSNSGLGALNLAVCLGANPIYLLGFDMKGEDGKQSWWHSGYPEKQREKVYKHFIESFNKVALALKSQGIEIINLNPESELKCFKFEDFDNIPAIKRPIIISYYTKNTGYESQVEYLKASVKRFNLDSDIVGIVDKGDWHKNVYYKPKFIMGMLKKHAGRPVVYVDADAVIKSNPVLFNNYNCDFACHFFQDRELLSGTMYFGNTRGSRYIVNKWLEEDRIHPDTHMPQKNLRAVFDKQKNNIIWKKLPVEYCRIYDSRTRLNNRPVIVHYQLSRMYKKTRARRFKYTMKQSLVDIQGFCKDKNICLLGNANSILCKPHDIDSFDIVCRMNRGSPRGKEKYIGSRTDILFISTGISGRIIQSEFDPKHLVWMTVCYRLASPYTLRNATQNPTEDWNELYKKLSINPTTGLMALNFILKHIKFKSLTIYGFDFFATKTWYNTRIDSGQKHSGKKEKALFMDMIKDNPKIKFKGKIT